MSGSLWSNSNYNLLFRWFVGLGMDERVWSPTTFTKNRDRLLDGDVATAFFEAVRLHAESERLLSHEHFTVDGTLLEAWASHKSFRQTARPRCRLRPTRVNAAVDFRGEQRTNATHQSTTDPDARLYKKGVGRPAQLAYGAHLLMENRSGLIVDTCVMPADGYGERTAALWMAAAVPGGRVTLGLDKGYDYPAFVAELRHMASPRMSHRTRRIAGVRLMRRTTRHAGYGISQRKRKLVEQAFGWMKTIGGLRKLRHRGGPLVTWIFTFSAAAYNIVRLRNLLYAAGRGLIRHRAGDDPRSSGHAEPLDYRHRPSKC